MSNHTVTDGMTAEAAAEAVCSEARHTGVAIERMFQGVVMRARPNSGPSDVLRYWRHASTHRWVLLGRQMEELHRRGIEASIGTCGGVWCVEVDGMGIDVQPPMSNLDALGMLKAHLDYLYQRYEANMARSKGIQS